MSKRLTTATTKRLEAILADERLGIAHYGTLYHGVKDGVLLNALDRQGIIRKHPHTNTVVGWYWNNIIARYIDDVLVDEVDGYEFRAHFVDGCFNPYLVVRKQADTDSKIGS